MILILFQFCNVDFMIVCVEGFNGNARFFQIYSGF